MRPSQDPARKLAMSLIVNRNRHPLLPHWSPRWNLLKKRSASDENINWIATSEREIEEWVSLNECMDSGEMRDVPSFSRMMDTIRIMSPTDSSYLLHCIIDPKLSVRCRSNHYRLLGVHLRDEGVDAPYLYTYSPLHHDFSLANDAYHFDRIRRKSEENGEERKSHRNSYDLATGLIHQAWMKTKDREGYFIDSVVSWTMIDWEVVQRYLPNYLNPLERGVRDDLSRIVCEEGVRDDLPCMLAGLAPSADVYETVPLTVRVECVDGEMEMENRSVLLHLLSQYIKNTSYTNVNVLWRDLHDTRGLYYETLAGVRTPLLTYVARCIAYSETTSEYEATVGHLLGLPMLEALTHLARRVR